MATTVRYMYFPYLAGISFRIAESSFAVDMVVVVERAASPSYNNAVYTVCWRAHSFLVEQLPPLLVCSRHCGHECTVQVVAPMKALI